MRSKNGNGRELLSSNSSSYEFATYVKMAPVIRHLFFFATSSKATGRTASLGNKTVRTTAIPDAEQHYQHHHRSRRPSHHKEGEEHRRRRRKSHRTHSTEEKPPKPARESHRTAKNAAARSRSHSRRYRSSSVSIPMDLSNRAATRSTTSSRSRAKESTRRDPPNRSSTQRAVVESWTRHNKPAPISLPLRLGEQSDRKLVNKGRPRSPAVKTKSEKRLSTEKQEKRGGGHRKTASSLSLSKRTVTCLTCLDDIPASKAAQLACSHSMCEDCLKRVFTMSVTDPQHMPPKCCTSDHIPLRHVDKLFDVEFKINWNKKYQEFTTENRVYCPAKGCGEWIKPSQIHLDISGGATGGRRFGICGSCSMKVCGLCNGQWHTGSECPKDDETRRFVEAAKENGWQRCPGCSAMVELTEGCNHMTCRCGAEFCIICAARWKTCACPWFNYRYVPELDADDGLPRPQVQQAHHARDYEQDHADYFAAIAAAAAAAAFRRHIPGGFVANPDHDQEDFQPPGVNGNAVFIEPFEERGDGEAAPAGLIPRPLQRQQPGVRRYDENLFYQFQ
ncbi:hypothetical protein ACJ73_07681 [Blastomyces percursus]|uniref:RBR-type E3 ubiquitin transferase n=1 Tax=Blastomyces percursus TaxID=1658174 RepID=A0A1J9PXD8_9EURO|nr:hypothetical protein ACJ73_07681 [Blastomyces percursus]